MDLFFASRASKPRYENRDPTANTENTAEAISMEVDLPEMASTVKRLVVLFLFEVCPNAN